MLPCDQYDSVRVSDVKGIFFCRFNPSKSTEAGGISCKVAFVDEEAVSDSEMKIAKYHYYAIMYLHTWISFMSYVISESLTASSSTKATLQLIPPASVLFEGLNLQKKIPFTSETLTESY